MDRRASRSQPGGECQTICSTNGGRTFFAPPSLPPTSISKPVTTLVLTRESVIARFCWSQERIVERLSLLHLRFPRRIITDVRLIALGNTAVVPTTDAMTTALFGPLESCKVGSNILEDGCFSMPDSTPSTSFLAAGVGGRVGAWEVTAGNANQVGTDFIQAANCCPYA